MPLASEPHDLGVVVSAFVFWGIVVAGGIVLLRSGRLRATPQDPTYGRGRRGWGITLIVVAALGAFGEVGVFTHYLNRSNTTGEDGFAGRPPHEIVNAAVDEMENLTSLRMSGTSTADGVTTALDIVWKRSGPCRITATEDDQELTLIVAGNKTYMKYNAAALEEYTSPAEARAWRELVGSRWALLSTDEVTQDLPVDQICSLVDRVDELRSDGPTTAKAVQVEQVGGQEAVRVDDDDAKTEGTVWVGVREPHRILRLAVSKDGLGSGDYTFTEFDEHDDLRVPAKGRWVDLRGEQDV